MLHLGTAQNGSESNFTVHPIKYRQRWFKAENEDSRNAQDGSASFTSMGHGHGTDALHSSADIMLQFKATQASALGTSTNTAEMLRFRF